MMPIGVRSIFRTLRHKQTEEHGYIREQIEQTVHPVSDQGTRMQEEASHSLDQSQSQIDPKANPGNPQIFSF